MQCYRWQHFATSNDLHEHPRRHSSWRDLRGWNSRTFRWNIRRCNRNRVKTCRRQGVSQFTWRASLKICTGSLWEITPQKQNAADNCQPCQQPQKARRALEGPKAKASNAACAERLDTLRGCASMKDGLMIWRRIRVKEKMPMKRNAGPKNTTAHSNWDTLTAIFSDEQWANQWSWMDREISKSPAMLQATGAVTSVARFSDHCGSMTTTWPWGKLLTTEPGRKWWGGDGSVTSRTDSLSFAKIKKTGNEVNL